MSTRQSKKKRKSIEPSGVVPKKRIKLDCEKKSKSIKKMGCFSSKSEIDEIESPPSSIIVKKPEPIKKFEPIWSDAELLSEQANIRAPVARNFIDLISDGNTLVFMRRYRFNHVDNMEMEKLREVDKKYKEVVELKKQIGKVLHDVNSTGRLTHQVCKSISAAKSFEELDLLSAPYKTKRNQETIIAKGFSVGLDRAAQNVLNNEEILLYDEVKTKFKNGKEIEDGLVQMISIQIAADPVVLEFVNKTLESYKNAFKLTLKLKNGADANSVAKYSNYIGRELVICRLKEHQTLAINRATDDGVLTRSVTIPDRLRNDFHALCQRKWPSNTNSDESRKEILQKSFQTTYSKRIQPQLQRRIWNDLKAKAMSRSCVIFSQNLRDILLQRPLRGCPIMGIDPGFTEGCKIAVIDTMGQVLSTRVIYPHLHKSNLNINSDGQLKRMLAQHSCSVIAIGNGIACRETEAWLKNLIQKRLIPSDIQYTIVNESGTSDYSCSAEASREFPNLNEKLRSAISIARRLQDPLSEWIKVDPKHLGIGMYQHDVRANDLKQCVKDTVTECVSFVGVDLNTAPQSTLQHVAGLTVSRAAEICKYRTENGPFIARSQLKLVSTIGPKTYQQCAGFLRITPTSNDFYNDRKTTQLDCTDIHPEMYKLTGKILKELGLDLSQIGTVEFIERIVRIDSNEIDGLDAEFSADPNDLRLIIECLKKPLSYDLRLESNRKPLFVDSLKTIDDLEVGQVVTGRVESVLDFAAFLDIGVGQSGFMHSSRMGGQTLQVGNHIEGRIYNLELNKAIKRIQIELIRVL